MKLFRLHFFLFCLPLEPPTQGYPPEIRLDSPGPPWNPVKHPLEFPGPPGTTWDIFGSYIAPARANAREPGDPVGHLGPKKCAHGHSQAKCERSLQ